MHDFPTEAVDSLVDTAAEEVIKEQVLSSRSAVEDALNLLSELKWIQDDLFTNLAKTFSTTQHMCETIRKTYGYPHAAANKKIEISQKWLVTEKDTFRLEANFEEDASRAASHAAAEQVLIMSSNVPRHSKTP